MRKIALLWKHIGKAYDVIFNCSIAMMRVCVCNSLHSVAIRTHTLLLYLREPGLLAVADAEIGVFGSCHLHRRVLLMFRPCSPVTPAVPTPHSPPPKDESSTPITADVAKHTFDKIVKYTTRGLVVIARSDPSPLPTYHLQLLGIVGPSLHLPLPSEGESEATFEG